MALIVLVTIPENKASMLAKKILQEHLCACVNIIDKVSSYFWWEGKIDQVCESLLIIKTKNNLFPELKRAIKKYHPYDIPEIVGLTADKINKEYLRWLLGEVKNG